MAQTADNLSTVAAHTRLHLSIQKPYLEECYLDGYHLAQAEVEEGANPYKAGSSEYEQWAEGWWDGFYNRTPIYQTLTGTEAEQTIQSKINGGAIVGEAANEPFWRQPKFKLWAGRVVKIAGAIAVTVAAYELMDIAV